MLQELDMQILPTEECKKMEGYYAAYDSSVGKCTVGYYSLAVKGKVVAHVLCAKNPELGTGTCEGDSGGPLTEEEDLYNMLIGIVSAGDGCGKPRVPGIYTRVSELSHWLESEVG